MKEVENAGMGEGQGMKDVSDQIEEEDQVSAGCRSRLRSWRVSCNFGQTPTQDPCALIDRFTTLVSFNATSSTLRKTNLSETVHQFSCHLSGESILPSFSALYNNPPSDRVEKASSVCEVQNVTIAPQGALSPLVHFLTPYGVFFRSLISMFLIQCLTIPPAYATNTLHISNYVHAFC